MENVLELYFLTEEGKTAKLSIDNPIMPVDQEAVKQAMDSIIESKVFLTKTGFYISKKEAQLVETAKTEYSFV
jgi:hypothetical protein